MLIIQTILLNDLKLPKINSFLTPKQT